MFNPFVPFHIKMIEGLRKMKRNYLVSQTNLQAIDHFEDDAKTPILLTDYDDKMGAQVHYNALTDKFRYILDLENEAHRNKIIEMIRPDSKYRVYAAFIEDVKQVEKRLTEKYSQQIRNYIAKETNWKIAAKSTVYPKLEVTFGELYIVLKYQDYRVERFKLSVLEKY